MSIDWKQLVEQLSKLQHEFIEAAQQLDEHKRNTAGVCGSWSPKQVIAHLSGWDKEVIRQFNLFQEGLEKAVEHNIDEFNKKSVLERSGLSWEETVAELQQAHEQLYQKAASITLQERTQNAEYRDWIEVQIDHYLHHTEQLKKWL